MTINELLTEIDEVMPHQYDDALLIKWLSNLEGKIVLEVFATHEVLEDEPNPSDFHGYTDSDIGAELLVKEPFTDLYRFYLMSQICFANQEVDRYTNEMIMFNASYNSFTSYWNSTHKPLATPLKLW